MAVDVSVEEFNSALWKRFKAGKIRNVYPLLKYNDIVEKIKTIERNPPCNTPGEYYLLRKFIVAVVDGKERLCCKPSSSVVDKSFDKNKTDLKFYVALEEIYHCIDVAHRSVVHGGKDRIVRSIQSKGVVNITKETVELFLSFCKVCRPRRKRDYSRITKTVSNRCCESPFNNSSESEGTERFSSHNNVSECDKTTSDVRLSETTYIFTRGFIELRDFSSTPDGDYRFVSMYIDLQTNFCVLHPIRCKCTYEIVSQLLNIFTLLGPPQILHSNFDESFMLEVVNEIKQNWPELYLVSGSDNYIEIQEVVRNNISELNSLLKSWMSDNNSQHWSSALKFIQMKKNTSLRETNSKSPYECLFGKSVSLASKFPDIDITVLKQIDKEVDLLNLVTTHGQNQHCENLQISLDPNICNFVQNHVEASPLSEIEPIIESAVVKEEPVSDSENIVINGIELSESSNDTCVSPGLGNLDIIIKKEPDIS